MSKEPKGMRLNFIDEFLVCPKCENGGRINVEVTHEHIIIECERCQTQVKEYVEDQL